MKMESVYRVARVRKDGSISHLNTPTYYSYTGFENRKDAERLYNLYKSQYPKATIYITKEVVNTDEVLVLRDRGRIE